MAKILYVMGDSHAGLFGACKPSLRRTELRIHTCPGATARSLHKEKSLSGAGEGVRRVLAQATQKAFFLFSAGDVDCNYTMWARAQQTGTTIDEQLDLTIDRYGLLLDLVEQTFSAEQVGAICTTLPVAQCSDVSDENEAAHQSRKDMTLDQHELDPGDPLLRTHITRTIDRATRTSLARRYNQRLGELCRQRGNMFLDYTADIEDPATGELAAGFATKDHDGVNDFVHLHRTSMRPILMHHLASLGFT